jgi:hypothetical protein
LLPRQLHLRLHTRDLRDSEACGLTSGMVQQRRLADPRLAPNNQRRALSAAHIRQQPIKR